MNSLQTITALCVVIGLGLTLGKASIRGIALGSSGVIFAGLIAGHFGMSIPKSVGTAGVILFVYCLGIGAGPSFIGAALSQGKTLIILAVSMILSAAGIAWASARILQLDADLASGLFAGALTSTPALAAAADQLPADSNVSVGFGIAYPFGVVGVILFVQFVPRLMTWNSNDNAELDEQKENGIERILVRIINPAMAGKRLVNVSTISHSNCQVSRILQNEKLQPIPGDLELELGQVLLIIGRKQRLADVIDVLGEQVSETNYILDVEHQRRRIVVTSKNVVGKSLEELHLRSRMGITITRITRQDVEFVPSPQEKIHFGDSLTAVGEEGNLNKFVEFAGHRARTADETDLVSLAFGLMLGIVLGRVEFSLSGESIALGMAGGPLIIGLLMGHVGRIGPFVGSMPRAARLLLGEIGLVMFLAQAGSQAGGSFVTVVQHHGIALCVAAAVITTVPLMVGLILARYVLGLEQLETLGGICGAMTSTPGLGAMTSTTDSSRPATSYATVYPLALVLLTLATPVLIAMCM